MENHGRKAAAWLPELEITGMDEPVVEVIDERSGETVYALRIQGKRFRPWVFEEGQYTVKVGEQPGRMKTLTGVAASKDRPHATETLRVALG